MPAGLADSADGETVFSRSGAWPSAWPCVSAGPSKRSDRGSRGAEKSPVGDSQDRSPLLAYNRSIWVVVRLRAWGTRKVWLDIQLTQVNEAVSNCQINLYYVTEKYVLDFYCYGLWISVSDAQYSTFLGLDSPHNFIRSDARVLKQSQGFSMLMLSKYVLYIYIYHVYHFSLAL